MTGPAQPKTVWQDWRTWAVLAALLVPLALLDTAHRFTASLAIRDPVPWNRVLARDLVIWLSYLPLISAVLFVAGRVRLDIPERRFRNATVHVIAAMLFVYVHLMTVSVVTAQTGLVWPSLRGVAGQSMPAVVTVVDEFVHYMRNNSSLDFLAYWAIVGVYYASHYYVESKEREVRAAQLEASLAAARLDALRSQLNPHFLFNTLNAVSVLAMKGHQAAVVDMLARVGELLRFSLDDARPQEIPLADELSFLAGYLDIQEIRFADRLTVRRDIAAEALPAAVPSMILQPIVENAIEHGVSEQCGAAYITIHASRDNGTLRLRVSDNGPGFQRTPSARRLKGIGLANTEARLQQLYGPTQRIDYGQSTDGGATVTISIPFRVMKGEGVAQRDRSGRS